MKPRWLGPYKVNKCLEKGLYRISNPKTGTVLKNTVNQCRLTVYSGSPPGDSSDAVPSDSNTPHSDFAPSGSTAPPPPPTKSKRKATHC